MNFFNGLTRALGALLIIATGSAFTPAIAHDTVAGNLSIDHPYARPNLPNRPSAAYMAIKNDGETADKLLSATSTSFGTIELHTVHEMDGVMKMMPIEAVDVPAGDTAVLEPGGMHLMLFDAKQRFKVGDEFEAQLTFEKAGAVTVTFKVEKPAHGSKQMDHNGHGTKKQDHSGHGSGS